MKKICSLLLAAIMLATVVFCPTAGVLTSAETATASTQEWSITNTYDDDGVYYLTSASDGENGNWRRKNNETDTFDSGTSIESDRIKDAVGIVLQSDQRPLGDLIACFGIVLAREGSLDFCFQRRDGLCLVIGEFCSLKGILPVAFKSRDLACVAVDPHGKLIGGDESILLPII